MLRHQPELGGVLDGDDALAVGMKFESMLRKVVFPVPVPPEIRMFFLTMTAARRKSINPSCRRRSRPAAYG